MTMTPDEIPAAPIGIGSAERCAGLSDRGRVRTRNEDRWAVVESGSPPRILGVEAGDYPEVASLEAERGVLLAVADGCGGHSGGEFASSAAVGAVVRTVLGDAGIRSVDPAAPSAERMIGALMEAGREAVESAARGAPASGEMATTLTLAWLAGEHLLVGHAGDSRAYVLRGRNLDLLTTDHNLAHDLVVEGAMTAEQEAKSPLAHVLSNALGHGSKMRPEILRTKVRPGDVVLLCTDGLTRHVDDRRISRILLDAATALEACERLVADANDRGGTDNITCVVVRAAGAGWAPRRRKAAASRA